MADPPGTRACDVAELTAETAAGTFPSGYRLSALGGDDWPGVDPRPVVVRSATRKARRR